MAGTADYLAWLFGKTYYQRNEIADDISQIERFYKLNTECLKIRQQLIQLGVYTMGNGVIVEHVMDFEHQNWFWCGYHGVDYKNMYDKLYNRKGNEFDQ